ncbi:DNA-binding Lrp family transcriptional regulator [Desulfitispora alkaliphila]|uniref:Lrp/AsnC family transcriptional regulator n=1 Tax=Desulfitispora alkaliphila TaxID=622674 RepID=UPI003D1B4370
MEQLKVKILEIIERNCKITSKDISMMLGINTDEVDRLIGEMEQENIILCYPTLINWEKAGGENVTALIDVKVQPQRGVGFDTVAERIYRFPEVKSVYLMSGGYDLSLTIEGTSMKKVALFVAEKLATLEFVQSTTTHFVLKKYKDNGIIYEDNVSDKRLVVSP